MMIGPDNAQYTCSIQPYMYISAEEINEHLSEMIYWMDQQDTSGLRDEMDSHREQMGSFIQYMTLHMQQPYSSQAGMMGGGMMGGVVVGNL
jgi:hypothetical protein